MGQQKYIIFAALALVIGAAIYLGFRKFSQAKIAENTSIIIDYDEPVEALPLNVQDGKRLYMSNCASCHHMFKDMTGPALIGVTERGDWSDSTKLYQYIREPQSFKKNKYVDSLRKMYGSNHMAFPDLSDNDIKAILRHINVQSRKPVIDIVD